MIDKLAKHALVSREKKLAKKLKNQAKKSSEKLLILLMKQEIRKIIIQNILESSLSVHKMMFQNLSSELQNNSNDNIVQVSSDTLEKELRMNDL